MTANYGPHQGHSLSHLVASFREMSRKFHPNAALKINGWQSGSAKNQEMEEGKNHLNQTFILGLKI